MDLDILKNRVVFNTDYLGSRNTPMREFRLPFPCIDIYLAKPYNGLDSISVIQLGKYYMIHTITNDVIKFEILDTGEIVIHKIPINLQPKLHAFKQALHDLISGNKNIHNIVGEEELTRDKQYYNLVYDLIATIDYLNTSKYVVTTHTTSKSGLKYKDRVEKRIKIKHTKYSHTTSTHKGTKHRYKYRVRGHFRELNNKTIWIKDYVRGGDGTIFIPKEYEL